MILQTNGKSDTWPGKGSGMIEAMHFAHQVIRPLLQPEAQLTMMPFDSYQVKISTRRVAPLQFTI